MIWLLACVGTGGVSLDDSSTSSDDSAVDTNAGGEHLIELSINEVMADNSTSYVLDDGSAPDWIELYNASEYDLDLEGFSLSDDFSTPAMSVIGSSLVVEAGDFIVLYADEGSAPESLDFRLDKDGDTLGVYTPDGQPIDLLEFGTQVQDTALARVEDGVEGEWIYVYGGTPGESNED